MNDKYEVKDRGMNGQNNSMNSKSPSEANNHTCDSKHTTNI